MLKNVGDLDKIIVATSCPKRNKSPYLVTLTKTRPKMRSIIDDDGGGEKI